MSANRLTLKLPRTIIQIDSDPSVVGKNYPTQLGLVGKARLTIQALIAEVARLQTYQPGRLTEVAAL